MGEQPIGEQPMRMGRVMARGVPTWRIRLAAPFFKAGIWILGGRNVWLEEWPTPGETLDEAQPATRRVASIRSIKS